VLADPSIIDNDKELYILSAMWFWGVEKRYEDLNKLADEDDIEKITKVISNSLDTKDNRKKILEKIKNELK
jgi:predicted chitinase